jgi:hypothetical protein
VADPIAMNAKPCISNNSIVIWAPAGLSGSSPPLASFYYAMLRALPFNPWRFRILPMQPWHELKISYWDFD